MNEANTKPPANRKAHVLDAATDVFLRHGFARTTMGDIARGVGISRPALYLVFSNKEEIFAAVIERLNQAQLERIRAELPQQATLYDKLLLASQTWGTHGFDLMQVHPDAGDLFDLSRPAVRTMCARFEALIAELLAEPVATTALDTTAAELARTLTYAMRGFKDTAADGADMRALIAAQVALVVAALDHG